MPLFVGINLVGHGRMHARAHECTYVWRTIDIDDVS